jgi:hypothetical protein
MAMRKEFNDCYFATRSARNWKSFNQCNLCSKYLMLYLPYRTSILFTIFSILVDQLQYLMKIMDRPISDRTEWAMPATTLCSDGKFAIESSMIYQIMHFFMMRCSCHPLEHISPLLPSDLSTETWFIKHQKLDKIQTTLKWIHFAMLH